MKVSLSSFQAVTILHGGPNTQLRMTAHHLPEFGVEPVLFDQWKPFGKGDVDLFHIFGANIGTYHLAREIHALGVPLVVSPITFSRHGSSFIRLGLMKTKVIRRFWRGFWSDYGLMADMCGWATAVLPNTGAEAKLVTDGLGVDPTKVTVVPNGVEERFATGDPALFRKKYGLENFILNVGHIGHERKNVLRLIQALGEIDHPSVIIGRIISGSYGDACIREAEKHKQIILIDGLDHDSEMLSSAYAACDVFVLPSLFETPGIAALEAALAGAKIVITAAGGTTEYFQEMVEYVDPNSVESIRKGILAALMKEKDGRLRTHIRDEYSWRQVAEKTAKVYRDVLERVR